jgi:hypothetical protein
MTTTQNPSALDAVLKAEITKHLLPHKDTICDNYDTAHDSYLELFQPLWESQARVFEEIEKHYFGSIGNRTLYNSCEMMTNMMSMLLPVFMRPQRFIDELPAEAQDQLARQHAYYNLSSLTGLPLPLLLPTDFTEFGEVGEIFDMIVSGPDGEPSLTQWAAPAISSLLEEGVDLPDDLAQLIGLPDSFV